MRKFPAGEFGRQKLQFFPAPFRAPLRAFASLVFPFHGERVLLCNIEDRGWCIPSGRVEPHETSMEAARREAEEEGGVRLGCLMYLGAYRMTERGDVRWADCYVAEVAEFAEILMPEESLGRKIVAFDELPSAYHMWNPLMECVFDHAREVIRRYMEHHGAPEATPLLEDPCQ